MLKSLLSLAGSVIALGIVITICTPGYAHAYIDPATGSIIIQCLLAGIAGALFMLKLWWRRIRTFLTSRLSGKGSGDLDAR